MDINKLYQQVTSQTPTGSERQMIQTLQLYAKVHGDTHLSKTLYDMNNTTSMVCIPKQNKQNG